MATFYGKLNQNAHVITLVKSIVPDEGPRVGTRSILMSLWLHQLENGDFANAVDKIIYADGHYPKEQLQELIAAEEFETLYKRVTTEY